MLSVPSSRRDAPDHVFRPIRHRRPLRKGGEDPDMAELAMTALVLALIIKILDRGLVDPLSGSHQMSSQSGTQTEPPPAPSHRSSWRTGTTDSRTPGWAPENPPEGPWPAVTETRQGEGHLGGPEMTGNAPKAESNPPPSPKKSAPSNVCSLILKRAPRESRPLLDPRGPSRSHLRRKGVVE